ncbi:flagellar hook-length control protein FliK [Roseateles sp. LYH14W]|uniref:Flagellar hook-length control protein FliK n=1 Tax=Pelomonas parva TaxID=3299032 RepID=A0ABW7EY27_9BURK
MLAQNIAPKPTALPPAVQPSLPANSAGGPSFAQFLTEQAPPPAQPDAEAPEPEAAADAAAPQAAPVRRAPVPAKPSGQARTPDAAAKVEPKADAKTEAAATSEAIASPDEDSPDTPELKEFTQLIGMSAPTAIPPDAAAAAADGQRAARRGRLDASADDAAAGRSAARGPVDAAADAGQTPHPKGADRLAAQAAQADERSARSDALQAASSSREATQDALPAAAQSQPGAPSFAAVLSQALPTLPGQADAAATATTRAALHEPLHSAAFAPELGTRVSLLAVDGVQHAELQLNPADMGPVSVQIVVDGNQAQVSFHALQAETRQALEQSLPDLAAALQGQGLTLSGGGVFQQASRDADQSRDGTNAGGGTRTTGSSNEPDGATAAPARRTIGLLDTFA